MERTRRPSTRLVLLVLCSAAGAAAVADAPAVTIAAAQVGAGELLRPTEHGFVPLPVIDLDVDLQVTGVMLRGRVAQTFTNPTAETIEVVYAFPLPDRAAVHHMEMRIGDRRIVSVVQEKHEAARTYETAQAAGRKTALVEQELGNLFTTRAANIGAGEEIVVTLEYLEEVAYRDDAFELRFPLTYVPRFTPPSADPLPPARDDVPFHAAVPAARLRVSLDPGVPLVAVTSASHAIEIDLRDSRARVTTATERVPADRDFLLRWRPAPTDLPEARVLIEDRDDGRYGLILLMPPKSDGAVGQGLPTETLFIVDVSGSMDGPPLRQAREALLAALDRLRPEDRFNILRFSDTFTPFADDFVQAEGGELEAARQWVRALRIEGGTMILPALVAGIEMLGQSRSAHAQRIVFLTDGAVSNEPEVLDAVAAGLRDARLHTIGLGHAPNSWLMRKMAWHGRGLCAFISDVGGARNGIDEFFARLERPVLEDVELAWDGAAPLDLLPARIPDLYAGEPLWLSFRLAPGTTPARLTVAGQSRVGRLERAAPLASRVADDAGLATRWARARVETLMDSLHEGADPAFVRAQVVDVALAFDLVTLYTSLVAVDHGQDDADLAADERVAALLPQGGTDAGLRWLVGLVLCASGYAWWLRTRATGGSRSV